MTAQVQMFNALFMFLSFSLLISHYYAFHWPTFLLWTSVKCPDKSWIYFQGSCYGYFINEVDFFQALSTCRNISNGQACRADLVSVHSEEERKFITDLCLKQVCISVIPWGRYISPLFREGDDSVQIPPSFVLMIL